MILASAMAALALWPVPVMVQAQEPAPKLVDVDWLKRNLTEENVKVVDLRSDVRYRAGHIPGAVVLNRDSVKSMDVQALTGLLERMGIDDQTMVVACSDESDERATWLVWMLDYLGHSTSAVLNGGFSSWVKAKGTISQAGPVITAKVYPLPATFREEIRASLTDVNESVAREDVLVLDACAGNQGAVHHVWNDDLTSNGTWYDTEKLRQTYKALGVTPEKTIIVTCGESDMATHTYFTLKYVLGYPRVKIVTDGQGGPSRAGESFDQNHAGTSDDPETLLQRRCTSCHGLKKVTRHKADRARWEKIIDNMIRRGAKLNDVEQLTLVEHLAKNAK